MWTVKKKKFEKGRRIEIFYREILHREKNHREKFHREKFHRENFDREEKGVPFSLFRM